MTPTPPYLTTLDQTSPGDTIAYQIPGGRWTTDRASDLAAIAPDDTPVVVLKKARAWPTEAIILIRKGRHHDAELHDVIATRDSDGDYKLVDRYGWLIANNSEYEIEEWEPTTVIRNSDIDSLKEWITAWGTLRGDAARPLVTDLIDRVKGVISSAAAIKETLA